MCVCAGAARIGIAYLRTNQRHQYLPWISPAGLLIKVVPDPGVGLDRHQTRHVHLLDVMSGGQHDLVGVGLETKERRRERDEEGRKDNTWRLCYSLLWGWACWCVKDASKDPLLFSGFQLCLISFYFSQIYWVLYYSFIVLLAFMNT